MPDTSKFKVLSLPPLFNLGTIAMTLGFQARMQEYCTGPGEDFDTIEAGLLLHLTGLAWAALCEEDRNSNIRCAVEGRGMILSAIPFVPDTENKNPEMYWIITYPGENTTFLLPSEY